MFILFFILRYLSFRRYMYIIVTARPSDMNVPTTLQTTYSEEFDGSVLDSNYFTFTGKYISLRSSFLRGITNFLGR